MEEAAWISEARRAVVAGEHPEDTAARLEVSRADIDAAVPPATVATLRLDFVWRQLMGCLSADLTAGERVAALRAMTDCERTRQRVIDAAAAANDEPPARRLDPAAAARTAALRIVAGDA